MIRLEQAPEPPVLQQNRVGWTAEYVDWHTTREGPEPRRYAHAQIRDALEGETSAKCAYCEALINDVAYTHIEHKLPKSRHPNLVCTWDNLTIGCPRCNTNKADYDDPDCTLLDPYIDDVETEIAFGGPLALPRGGARARMTVSRLDLNRKELLFNRAQTLVSVDKLLDVLERTGDDVALSKAIWAEIDRLTASDSEFASACRYFVDVQSQERGLERLVD